MNQIAMNAQIITEVEVHFHTLERFYLYVAAIIYLPRRSTINFVYIMLCPSQVAIKDSCQRNREISV